MKILMIMDQFDNENNGTTMSAVRFVEALRQKGHIVKVVSTGKNSPDKFLLKELPMTPLVSYIIKSQGMTFAVPNEAILREAISWADVVHFYMPFWLSQKGLKITQELQVPHTAAFHVQPENITYTLGLGKSDKVNDAIYSYFRDRFFDFFSHIHCPSQFIANELKRHGYTAQLHVISNGVDDDFHYRQKKKPVEWEDRFVITMVGRYSNEKRQDLLLKAIHESHYRDQIQLVLAGKGLNEKKYRDLGKDLKYPPILQFYTKTELLDLLAMTDLYVHASDAEIEAISCIEAFCCGNVPLIANSSKSATPQFALDDRSLFEAGNSLDLARKIDFWIEHPDERVKMQQVYATSGEQYRLSRSICLMEEMFYEAIRDTANRKEQ